LNFILDSSGADLAIPETENKTCHWKAAAQHFFQWHFHFQNIF
jgi:DNA-binding ferritin-like protein